MSIKRFRRVKLIWCLLMALYEFVESMSINIILRSQIGLVSIGTLTRVEKPNCVPEAFNYQYQMLFNTVLYYMYGLISIRLYF